MPFCMIGMDECDSSSYAVVATEPAGSVMLSFGSADIEPVPLPFEMVGVASCDTACKRLDRPGDMAKSKLLVDGGGIAMSSDAVSVAVIDVVEDDSLAMAGRVEMAASCCSWSIFIRFPKRFLGGLTVSTHSMDELSQLVHAE